MSQQPKHTASLPIALFLACQIFLQPSVFGADRGSIFDDPATIPQSKPPVKEPPAQHNPPSNPVTHEPTPPTIAVAPSRLAPPDPASKAKLLKLIKEIYDKQYAEAGPAAKRQLAHEMIVEADKIKSNFAARYVLLQEAESAAIAGGDIVSCRKAVEGLSATFNIDAAALTTEALTKLSAAPGSNEAKVTAWGIEAIEARFRQDDYAGAKQLLRTMSGRLARVIDPSMRARIKATEAGLSEYDRVHPLLAKLKADPSDSRANLAVGEFQCFYKHDWAHGLRLIAKGSDAKLAELARQDVADPTEASAQFALAGLWWDLGLDRAHAAILAPLHERATYWYEKASPQLNGLDKLKADKRLAEIPAGASSTNLLALMVPEGSANANPQRDGSVSLTRGSIKTQAEITAPVRLDFVLKTTSEQCSIRIEFANGELWFRWEDKPKELNYWDPGSRKQYKVQGMGDVPINQFIHITWIVREDTAKVLVDGEERIAVKGDHKSIAGNVVLKIWDHPGLVIQSVTATGLSRESAKPSATPAD